ncbi:MAG: AAA family ATPase, partial [Melioribacteraceae bacterium]
NKYFAKDAALERRFQPIHIGEPDDDKAMLMMRGIKKKYEEYHGIHITDDAIEAAVKLSRRYIAGRQLPDKSVDLLDTAATRVKMSLTSKPPILELKISEMKSVEIAIESLKKDADLDLGNHDIVLKELNAKRNRIKKEVEADEKKWEKECKLINQLIELRKSKFSNDKKSKQDKKIDSKIKKINEELYKIQGDSPQVYADVTANIIAEVIEAWTGIQVGNMTRDEITTLLEMEDELKKRVVGQDHAIKQIADVIRGAKIGIKNEEAPIGVFLLVGPSGVGKTELARAAAEVLFGDERFMVTLNMTEYQNEHNTSRLIGADPGLVGYGEGGALSEPVRRRPYCVVLLDEIEKANLSVIDIFMQVFDRGMLKDADRRDINFSNTIIFMTSNLASDVLFEKYNEGITSPDDLLEELRPYMNQYFRPEFLGRVKPIIFLPLASDVMKTIVNIKLNKMAKRLYENQKLTVEFKEPVIDQIVAACTRAETGARNIDAIVDKTLAPEISSKLLEFMTESKSPTKLTISKGNEGEFKYKFI